MKIGFLGCGAMGSRMAKRLIRAGHEVSVFNRSPERVAELVQLGAVECASPREAALDRELVISMVRDDSASRDIWWGEKGALSALSDDAFAVECSTVSSEQARALESRMKDANVSFALSPVLGSLPQAEAGELVVLLGASDEVQEQLAPVLRSFAKKVLPLGEPRRAAAFKLVVNGLLALQVAGLAELLSFSRESGLTTSDASRLLSALPVTSAAASAALPLLVSGEHANWFPVELVEKDVSYITRSNAKLPVLEAVRRAYSDADAAGHGARHLTAVETNYR